MNQLDINDRQTLQKIREMAGGMAEGNLNPLWGRAYTALADAADRLDALHARCTVAAVDPTTTQNCGLFCGCGNNRELLGS